MMSLEALADGLQEAVVLRNTLLKDQERFAHITPGSYEYATMLHDYGNTDTAVQHVKKDVERLVCARGAVDLHCPLRSPHPIEQRCRLAVGDR